MHNLLFTISQRSVNNHDKITSYSYTKRVPQRILDNYLCRLVAACNAFEEYINNSLYPIDIILLNALYVESYPLTSTLELESKIQTLYETTTRLGYSWSCYDIEQRLQHLSTSTITLESIQLEKRRIKFFDKISIKRGKIKMTLNQFTIFLYAYNRLVNHSLKIGEESFETSKDKLNFLLDNGKYIQSLILGETTEDIDDTDSNQE